MKQVLQTRNGVTVVRDVPAPPCPEGGVLVQNAFSVISSGTERSRVELSKQSLLGKARARPDLVRQVADMARREGLEATRRAVQAKLSTETAVGYASAGTVLEVGRRVAGLRPGDRVACAGVGHANHAEIVAVPRNLVARVPEAVSLSDAAFATIAAISLHGLRLAEVELGSRVAIVGCGLIGQIACRLATAAGLEVFGLDVDAGKVAAVIEAGADHGVVVGSNASRAIHELTDGLGVDAVIVTAAASTSDPLVLAAEIARDRGSVVLVGAVPIEFPRGPLYEKELRFRVSRSYGPGRYDSEYEERGLDYPIGYVRWTEQRNMEAILSLLARGRLSVADLADEVIPVDDAVRGYSRLTDTANPPQGAIVLSYEVCESRQERTSDEAVPVRRAATDAAPRIALVGAGSFASKVLVPAFRDAGSRLVVAAGGKGPSAEAATRLLGFDRSAEVDDVLTDPDVDAIVVATRHQEHASLTTRALMAGKHVFVEKPLALSWDELREVMAAAHRADTILAVGFNRRFSPFVRGAAEALAKGRGPTSIHYRVAAGHIPQDHWVHDLEEGGGRLIGEACHFVDTARALVGVPIQRVFASGFGSATAPVQAFDNCAITLEFADRSVATILYAAEGGAGVPKERLEAFRTGVTVVVSDFKTLEIFGPDGRRRVGSRTQDKGHRDEVAAFVQGLRTRVRPIPLEEIENVMEATFAIVDSIRAASPVVL